VSDVIVRATALRWASDDFPGWVEVVLADRAGRLHHIVEKIPVLTRADVTAASVLPSELWLRAAYQRTDGGEAVIVHLLDGVTTTEDLHELSVAVQDLRWL